MNTFILVALVVAIVLALVGDWLVVRNIKQANAKFKELLAEVQEYQTKLNGIDNYINKILAPLVAKNTEHLSNIQHGKVAIQGYSPEAAANARRRSQKHK